MTAEAPSPESIRIEPCPAERDAEAAAFLRNMLYSEFGFTPDRSLDKDFQGLIAHYRRGRGQIWIALDRDRIVATTALLDLTEKRAAGAIGGDAELKRMFVERNLRGKGLGRELLAIAIDHAQRARFDRIVLDSTRDMTAAITLYKSAGFEEIPDYNGNTRADIFMALRLTGPPPEAR